MDPDVPLIVPQVNPEAIKNIKKNIIANPNCSATQLVIVLKPLHDLFNIERIVVSTYQSVSGSGKDSMDELIEQTKLYLENKEIKSINFTKQIAFNAIPHIDSFVENGNTKEEEKMINETKKILDEGIKVSATCVRIPVFVSHAESINIEFDSPLSEKKAIELLSNFENISVVDHRKDEGYVTPVEAAGEDKVYVSRIREDHSVDNGLNIWVVSDNLRKGAALNAVQIAEVLIKKYPQYIG
jgi:aspartate-semialdehyde dehydrogenase